METNLIEKMEKKRFYALLMRTISGVIMFGIAIVMSLTSSSPNLVLKFYILFTLVYIVVNWRTCTVLEKIQKDKRLANALNSEMYASYKYRSMATGLYSTITCVFLIFCLDGLFVISIQSYCMIILFVAVFAVQVHQLILYKP